MSKLIFVLILFSLSFGTHTVRDSLLVTKSMQVDSAFYVGKKPLATNPKYAATFDSAGNLMKIWPIDSIQKDSVTYSVYSDTSDTALHTPDSVRAAHKADSSGKADTSRVSGTSYGFVHGVPAGILLKAKSASACTSSHVSENGDTVKITYTSAPGDTFYNSSLTGTSTFKSGCLASNGDCYFFRSQETSTGAVYIQYAGSGSLVNLSQPNRNYIGSAAISNGDVFTCVYGGSREYIYKRTGGSGNFNATSLFGYWYDMKSYLDTIYALNDDSSGTVVKIDPSTSTMTNMNITPDYQFVHIDIDDEGNIFLIRSGSYDIYKVVRGTSSAVAMGFTARSYLAMGIDTLNTLYLGTSTAIYRQLGGSGGLSFFQTIGTPLTDFFNKSNGDVYGMTTHKILIKSNEQLQRIFNVSGGNSNFAGKVDIENTPTTTTATWVLGKNAAPDNEIKKIAIASFDSVSNADSANYLRHLNDATIDISIDSGTIRIVNLAGLPSGGTGDSCLILKNGVPTIVSASSYRTMIGAATPQQISDSIANMPIGSGSNYFIPKWSGVNPNVRTLVNTSMLNIGATLMNIGSASSFQVINTDTNESSSNIWFNNADTKYYAGGINLTYHKIQNDSGYSHFEIRSYSSAGKYLTFLRIDEQGGLNLNHADYDDTRVIPAMTVDNGGLNVADTIWTGIGTSKYLSMFNSDGAIINSGIIDSGNVLSTPETTTVHNRNWDSNTGYFQVGTITGDSSSYFKMYNKVSGGNTVLRNKNGIGLLTPGSYVVAEDDFHTQYNEEGVAYVNGSKSVRSIIAIDSIKLKSLDSVYTVFEVVDSIFDGGTFRTAGIAYAYKTGRSVTVTIKELTGTVTTDTTTYVRFGSNFPDPLTGSFVEPSCVTYNGGQVKLGWMRYISARKYEILNYDNSNLSAGTSGIWSVSFTYICN
ncbi:MAG: hypothetical protein PHN44_00075 [Candidatus Marinimicrobia bacterium]|nr:hypothetical protein [Candidatus Neomarinimicrobiota bacterium]